jgi:hypothetical protein
MAETPETPQPEKRELPKFNLDDARDFVYKTMRTMEKYIETLHEVVEMLAEKKEGDEWLFELQTEASHGYHWAEHQLYGWDNFKSRIDKWVLLRGGSLRLCAARRTAMCGLLQGCRPPGRPERQTRAT